MLLHSEPGTSACSFHSQDPCDFMGPLGKPRQFPREDSWLTISSLLPSTEGVQKEWEQVLISTVVWLCLTTLRYIPVLVLNGKCWVVFMWCQAIDAYHFIILSYKIKCGTCLESQHLWGRAGGLWIRGQCWLYSKTVSQKREGVS